MIWRKLGIFINLMWSSNAMPVIVRKYIKEGILLKIRVINNNFKCFNEIVVKKGLVELNFC